MIFLTSTNVFTLLRPRFLNLVCLSFSAAQNEVNKHMISNCIWFSALLYLLKTYCSKSRNKFEPPRGYDVWASDIPYFIFHGFHDFTQQHHLKYSEV